MKPIRFRFDIEKTAQAVVFLLRLSGGQQTKGVLLKMLYAADKGQLKSVGVPLTGAQPFSMENGPILSEVLDLFNGRISDPTWERHIARGGGLSHGITIREDMPEDLLSANEKESLLRAWRFFSPKSWDQIVEDCHNPKFFPEWSDPGETSTPIQVEAILKSVQKSKDFIEDVRAQVAEADELDRIFAADGRR